MKEFTKELTRSEIINNYIKMKKDFLEHQFPKEPFLQFTLRIENNEFFTRTDDRFRVFGMPLKKMGFKAGDTLVMKKIQKNQVILEKVCNFQQ